MFPIENIYGGLRWIQFLSGAVLMKSYANALCRAAAGLQYVKVLIVGVIGTHLLREWLAGHEKDGR